VNNQGDFDVFDNTERRVIAYRNRAGSIQVSWGDTLHESAISCGSSPHATLRFLEKDGILLLAVMESEDLLVPSVELPGSVKVLLQQLWGRSHAAV
jgi:hypothetical protein